MGIGNIEVIAVIAAIVVIMPAAAGIYRRIPARWLCEYDELPGEIHMMGFRWSMPLYVRALVFMIAAAVFYTGLCSGIEESRAEAAFTQIIEAGVQRTVEKGAAGAETGRETQMAAEKGTAAGKIGGAVCLLVISAVLAVIVFCDIEYMIIPDQLLGVLTVCATAGIFFEAAAEAAEMQAYMYSSLPDSCMDRIVQLFKLFVECFAGRLTASLQGALTAALLMFCAAALPSLVYGESTAGSGDIKMLAAVGFVCGTPAASAILFSAAVMSAAVFMTAAEIAGRLRHGDFVPMAPFIAGALIPAFSLTW